LSSWWWSSHSEVKSPPTFPALRLLAESRPIFYIT
jgi:hypothetical protein